MGDEEQCNTWLGFVNVGVSVFVCSVVYVFIGVCVGVCDIGRQSSSLYPLSCVFRFAQYQGDSSTF